MRIPQKLRHHLFAAGVLVFVFASAPTPAHAVSKEIVELQTQVQQLLDMVQRLQSTLDTRFGVLQHLVEQTADNANQMTVAVTALQQKINAQNEASGGKIDALSGQVQSVNDSLDELKSRIAKLDKSVQDLQTQMQNIQSQAPTQAVAPIGPPGGPQTAPPPGDQPNNGQGPGAAQMPATQGGQAPPLAETFQAALRDYNSAHYQVAAGEFQDVIHYYPLDDLAGTSQFYLGEIAYRQQNYNDAVKAFNAVLEGFSGSPKAPAAQLRKGLALLALNKKDAGVHELRLLIQRHPQTPEAAQARAKLNGMGVRITPAH